MSPRKTGFHTVHSRGNLENEFSQFWHVVTHINQFTSSHCPLFLNKKPFLLLKFLDIFNLEFKIIPFFGLELKTIFSFFFLVLNSKCSGFLGLEIETFLFLFVSVLESRQLFWSRTRDVPCFFGFDINTIFFSLFLNN